MSKDWAGIFCACVSAFLIYALLDLGIEAPRAPMLGAFAVINFYFAIKI